MIRSVFNTVAEQEKYDDRDIADTLNKYFDDFEYLVYTNRFALIDKRVPFLIIRKFKRLFEIWDENVMFSKFLEEDSFREIFILMHNVFGSSINKCSTTSCYLECELCGEEIVLRNNDPEYSYRLHEMSRYHLEFIRNLRAVRSKEEVDVIFSQSTNDEGIFLECHLCWISIPIAVPDEKKNPANISVMESHQHDEKHQKNMELYNSNKNHISVYNVVDKLYTCTACEEIYHVDLLIEHLKNPSHHVNCSKEPAPTKKNSNKNDSTSNVAVQSVDFGVFKTNMILIHVVDNLIQCVLCKSNLNSVNMIVEHLVGKQHAENLKELMSSKKPIEEADQVQVQEISSQQSVNDASTGESIQEITVDDPSFMRKLNFIPICCLFAVLAVLIMMVFQKL